MNIIIRYIKLYDYDLISLPWKYNALGMKNSRFSAEPGWCSVKYHEWKTYIHAYTCIWSYLSTYAFKSQRVIRDRHCCSLDEEAEAWGWKGLIFNQGRLLWHLCLNKACWLVVPVSTQALWINVWNSSKWYIYLSTYFPFFKGESLFQNYSMPLVINNKHLWSSHSALQSVTLEIQRFYHKREHKPFVKVKVMLVDGSEAGKWWCIGAYGGWQMRGQEHGYQMSALDEAQDGLRCAIGLFVHLPPAPFFFLNFILVPFFLRNIL